MKKVVLLVPTKILVTAGTAWSSETEAKEVTADLLIRALTEVDYHLDIHFPEHSIQVVSIEEVG